MWARVLPLNPILCPRRYSYEWIWIAELSRPCSTLPFPAIFFSLVLRPWEDRMASCPAPAIAADSSMVHMHRTGTQDTFSKLNYGLWGFVNMKIFSHNMIIYETRSTEIIINPVGIRKISKHQLVSQVLLSPYAEILLLEGQKPVVCLFIDFSKQGFSV